MVGSISGKRTGLPSREGGGGKDLAMRWLSAYEGKDGIRRRSTGVLNAISEGFFKGRDGGIGNSCALKRIDRKKNKKKPPEPTTTTEEYL